MKSGFWKDSGDPLRCLLLQGNWNCFGNFNELSQIRGNIKDDALLQLIDKQDIEHAYFKLLLVSFTFLWTWNVIKVLIHVAILFNPMFALSLQSSCHVKGYFPDFVFNQQILLFHCYSDQNDDFIVLLIIVWKVTKQLTMETDVNKYVLCLTDSSAAYFSLCPVDLLQEEALPCQFKSTLMIVF